MKTVHEVSRLSGVSVRTLHHYDAIGLLKPTDVTDAGYRLYDDKAVSKLQTILLFRELQFSLKDINKIVNNPGFDKSSALRQQKKLLIMKQNKLGELISYTDKLIKTGVDTMDFKAFDNNEIDKYKEEVKQKWGNTSAYGEYEKITASKTEMDQQERINGLMQIFSDIGEIKNLPADSEKAVQAVEELKNYISENFYTCTNEILSGLGKMYVGDERMLKNIDKSGGAGTAQFASKAIELYCQSR